jgi:hypothetical protein
MNTSDDATLLLFTGLLGGDVPNTCVHGKSQPHDYGMGDDPDYDGGVIYDILLRCHGKPVGYTVNESVVGSFHD